MRKYSFKKTIAFAKEIKIVQLPSLALTLEKYPKVPSIFLDDQWSHPHLKNSKSDRLHQIQECMMDLSDNFPSIVMIHLFLLRVALLWLLKSPIKFHHWTSTTLIKNPNETINMNQTEKYLLRNSKNKWIKFSRRWEFLMERHNFIKVLALKESLLRLHALVIPNSWFSIYKLHFCNLELEMMLGSVFTPTHLQLKMKNIYKLVIRQKTSLKHSGF